MERKDLWKETEIEIENLKTTIKTLEFDSSSDFDCYSIQLAVMRDLERKAYTIAKFKTCVINEFKKYHFITDVKVHDRLRKYRSYSPFISSNKLGIDLLNSMIVKPLIPIYKPYAIQYICAHPFHFLRVIGNYNSYNAVQITAKTYQELSEEKFAVVVDWFLNNVLTKNAFQYTSVMNVVFVYRGRIYNTTLIKSNKEFVELQVNAVIEFILNGDLDTFDGTNPNLKPEITELWKRLL